MGYVVNRGSKDRPKWYAKYKDVDGSWKQKNTKQVTKASALRFVAEIDARVARGEIGIPEPTQQELTARTLTVADLCERFLKEYSRPRIKDIEAYRRHTRSIVNQQILRFPIARMVASEVKSVDVERWRDALRQEAYVPHTVNRGIAVLSGVYGWAAVQEILTTRNPCSGVERMPARPSDEHYSMDEVHKLLSLPEVPAMLATALYAGMRKGELFGLTWACVRLDGEIPRIEVRKSYTGLPKSGKPRTVPIHVELLAHLRAWQEKCPATADGLVFPVEKKTKGRKLTGIYRMGDAGDMEGIREILTAAGCHAPSDPWHACRHSFSTHLLEASGNGHALSSLLGHSTGSGMAAITAGYTHTSLKYLAGELAKMTLAPPALADVIRLDEVRRQRASEG